MSKTSIEILACEPTPIGLIILRRREIPSEPGETAVEITLDHEFLMSSRATASERALAHRALALHAEDPSVGDCDVLVGGLGLGCTAQAVLESSRVRRLEVVELLQPVIDWLQHGLLPLSGELLADRRLAITRGDVYALLAGAPRRTWDLVLVDVDHSPDEPLGDASRGFYAEGGLARARAHLSPGGILGVWSYAPSPGLAGALERVFSRVVVEPIAFDNPVAGGSETNWIYLARR